MLSRVTIKGLKQHNTRNGVAWSASVYIDGLRKMLVENGGDGGCCKFTPLCGFNYASMRIFLEAANKAAAQCLGETRSDECFENLLACMDRKGMTALEAVPHLRAALAAAY
jgi:hypothetical protein